MFGLGEFALGGFPLSDSLSVSDPLPGILTNPSIDREFLLRAAPGGTLVDLSSSGYNSLSTDSPYKAFPEAIIRPYNFSVELPLPDLSGGATLGAGEILAKNADGSLDSSAILDWLGVDADVYIGRKSQSLAQFTRFSRGTSSGVSWDLNSISILHKDARFRLQKRLQVNRYMGTGPCLYLDGSGDRVSYGDILDQISSASFTVEILFSGASGWIFSKRQDDSTPSAGWHAQISGSGILARISDGTNVATATGAIAVTDAGRLRRLSLVINRSDQTLKIYINGVLDVSVSCSAVGNLSNAINMLVGAAGNTFGVFTGRLDDFRFWSVARTQLEIQSDMHRELSGTETGLQIYSKYNEGSGSTADDSTANNRDGTITGCTWVGSLEGDSSIANTPKPILVGIKRYILPKLVDSQRLVYQVHDGSVLAIDAVYDGGDDYTLGSDLADIYSSVPAAGTYNTCLAKGLFRLGSSPVGVIQATVRGDNAGSLGYVDTVAGIHRKIATYPGLLVDDDLNLNTYSALALKATAKIGFYFDSEINGDAALDEIMKNGGLCWWSPDRVARISVGRIDNPTTLDADITVTTDDLVETSKGGSYKRTPVGVRVGTVVLGYRRYNTQLTPDQVAGVVDLATRNDLGKEYRFVKAQDPDRSDDSDTMEVFTEIDLASDAQIEADRLLALWKVDRGTYRITMDQGVLSYFIGTVINLVVNRYDTASGKKFVVFGLSETMGEYGSPDRLEPALFG